LERTIDWSYDMLDEDQRGLFRRLSLFRGGFTLAACAAVGGMDDEFEALDALSQLVDKSLVRTRPSGDETRYYLLEPLRQYGAARIKPEEAAASGGDHARYFRDLVDQISPGLHGPQQLALLAQLETEHDNLRAALAFGLTSGDVEPAQRIASGLMWFWVIRRHVAEAADGYERVLAADATPTNARAWTLLQAGWMRPMIHLDDLEGCLTMLRDAQAQLAEFGDDQGEMTARMYITQNLWFQRDLAGAADLLVGIQAEQQAIGFEWGDAFAGFVLASTLWFAGDVRGSHAHYTHALELFRRVGDASLVAWARVCVANIAVVDDELGEAAKLYDECLAMMVELGDRHGTAAALLGSGFVAHLGGEAEEAERLLMEAQTHLREGGGGQALSWPLSNTMVDTHTYESLLEVTRRYYDALTLPAAEWVQMVCADGEVFLARLRLGS
jgi:hypothetical protein